MGFLAKYTEIRDLKKFFLLITWSRRFEAWLQFRLKEAQTSALALVWSIYLALFALYTESEVTHEIELKLQIPPKLRKYFSILCVQHTHHLLSYMKFVFYCWRKLREKDCMTYYR